LRFFFILSNPHQVFSILTSAGRQEQNYLPLRLCALARRKKKKGISAAADRQARLRQAGFARRKNKSRKDAKQGRRKGFFAAAESLYEKKSPLPP
jgi:hypothetical protein